MNKPSPLRVARLVHHLQIPLLIEFQSISAHTNVVEE